MASPASRKLLQELPSDQDMQDTLVGLLDNTDHAAAITGAAYVEHALEILLKASFRKMTKDEERRMFDVSANGILATFSAKIRAAYAIRLIPDDIYRDLLLISNIRNAFAHTLHKIDFGNSHISQDVDRLHSVRPISLAHRPEAFRYKYVTAVLSIYISLRDALKGHLLVRAIEDRAARRASSPDKPR